jgi:hypothetical protein
MRLLAAAACACASLAAPAGAQPLGAAQDAWPFERVAELDDQGSFALDGARVYTHTNRTRVTAHPGGQRLKLPRGTQNVSFVEATPKALLVFVMGPDWRVLYGSRGGPLKRHKRFWTVAAAVTGDRLLTVERDQRWIYVRDVDGGPLRRLARPGRELTYLQATGNYVAAVSEQKRLIVVDIRTGRTVYRVPFGGYYRLSANGRVVFIDDEFERIRTATPRKPKLRTIARVRTGVGLAVANNEIVFNEQLSDSTGRLVLLTPDGRRRPLTPRMRLTGQVEYDGRTLAFVAGRCLFKGPIATATGTPPEDCYAPE